MPRCIGAAGARAASLARSAGVAPSPVFAWLLQGLLLVYGVPLLLVGPVKAAGGLPLWQVFRRVRIERT